MRARGNNALRHCHPLLGLDWSDALGDILGQRHILARRMFGFPANRLLAPQRSLAADLCEVGHRTDQAALACRWGVLNRKPTETSRA